MKFFALFIYRPVATILLSIAITLCGVLGFRLLPVAPLPQVDFPVIMVSASLPGASPETMASSVATPLERSLGRIAGVNEMTSSSSLGSTRIILEFSFDRDINGAARDVQAAINAAQSLLPSGMPSRPTYRKANPSDAPIMILTLTSDTYSQGQLYDFASTQLAQTISQINGVGDVSVGGSSLPAVRVGLNPQALFNQGVSLDDVRSAISSANVRKPQGAIEDGSHRWQIQTNDELKTAAEYQPLIIHYNNGAAVRLSDVASVTDSVQDVRNAGMTNAKPAILLMIRKLPEANIIETVNSIRARLPDLQETIPAAIDLQIAQDRSPTIRASLEEVEQTLIISVALVILVVFLFLRSGRATLIPAVAVPVSLIGTFAAMYLCGFSLNNLSLMALTIATGFVVDDAIVVLENISRHLEAGVKPLQAALQGTREVGFTVLSDDLAALREWEPKIRKALAALPELADVNSDQQDNGAEMALTYDRETMSRLGINVEAANSLLNNAFGQREISTIYQPMNQYKVVMEVDPRYTQDISALDKMFVINSDGKAIPLSYFASWRPANAPLSVNHQGLSAASTISFNLPAGSSLSEASDAINRGMTQLGVPSTVRGSFAGTAQVFQETMNSQVILILAAIATVYIVLGVLYESYVHPLTILSTLPSAGVGALLALELFGAPFSLIALIGIMLLIGIVKKNAIMMVDFALDAQRNGNLSPEEAIFQACLLRFRPIMMTTLAALFGALPLVISGGDGSELRQPLGITIVGGLVMSQLLTLYTTPVVYLFFDRLRLRFSRKNRETVNG